MPSIEEKLICSLEAGKRFLYLTWLEVTSLSEKVIDRSEEVQ